MNFSEFLSDLPVSTIPFDQWVSFDCDEGESFLFCSICGADISEGVFKNV